MVKDHYGGRISEAVARTAWASGLGTLAGRIRSGLPQSGARPDAQLVEHVLDVMTRGVIADAQFFGDLGIRSAAFQQA